MLVCELQKDERQKGCLFPSKQTAAGRMFLRFIQVRCTAARRKREDTQEWGMRMKERFSHIYIYIYLSRVAHSLAPLTAFTLQPTFACPALPRASRG